MESKFSELSAVIQIKRTKFDVRITVYASYTVITINSKKLTALQLQAIIDDIFFFDDVDYHARFNDCVTVVYCDSASVRDKYLE